jgi:two-component system CheB/CheR fusion protein
MATPRQPDSAQPASTAASTSTPAAGQGAVDQQLYSLIVIGASAGGIEAITKILPTLPADFPVPIVVAQHLDPGYPSRFAEILAQSSRLPIHTITDHEPIVPGVVYVAPENRHVEIDDGHLRLMADRAQHPMPSINRLLTSAAHTYGEHLIAVILTGTGSDGAAGAREVKASDGTVIIENPETAAFPGMPSALAAATVDLVADLSRIGPLLQDLVSGTTIAELPAIKIAPEEPAEPAVQSLFQAILVHLREQSGIDFTDYKYTTILRRLQRRMAAVDASDLAEYASYLTDHPDEYGQLASSFLIKMTEFFRDPEIFDVLRDRVLPDLIAQARMHGNTLRIWSAGCATGEEAYSIAILVAEALGDELAQFRVQIFATDLDGGAIAVARQGVYPAAALDAMPKALRARYFSRLDGSYEVAKLVRGMVVFGVHDLGRQAPFPHLDLVLCRNVLIYFNSALQTRALQLFAFALRTDGYLVLGKAETNHPLEAYFAPADGQLKLYRRQGGSILPPISQGLSLAELLPPNPKRRLAIMRRPPAGQEGAVHDLGAGVLAQPSPGSVRGASEWLGNLVMGLPLGVAVIDRHYDIQAINAIALRLFGIYVAPLGEDLIHLTQSIPTTAMRAAIDTAFREMRTPEAGEAREAGPAAIGSYRVAETIVTVETVVGERRHLRISCYPYVPPQSATGGAETASTPSLHAAAEAVLLLIDDVTPQVEAQQRETNQTSHEHAADTARQVAERDEYVLTAERLEGENARLKQENAHITDINRSLLEANQTLSESVLQLRHTNDELVVNHEEAQANAEEVKTLNEELQATNEEHVTVNEELEATVEELRIANEELQSRSRELQESAVTLAAQRMASETERARLEAILLSLGDAVLVVDRAGASLLTNAAYEAMFGGMSATFVAADEVGNPLPAELTPQGRAARGEAFTMGFTLTNTDGARRYFEASGQPIRGAGGKDLDGGVIAIRDITERTQRYLQDEFVRLASHELRTPLTPLSAYLEMLGKLFADRPEDDRARSYTERAKHQVDRLRQLTTDLTDVSRLQSGKFDVIRLPVRLDEVVATAVDAAQTTLPADRTIHLERPDTPLIVNGDSARLEQVLMNLLTNAITYAPQSQRIDVRMRRVGNEAEVQVQDYGLGIPEADLPHLFSQFYQVQHLTDDRPSRRGLGLGLYIAHAVVAAHDGHIEAASVEAPRDGHGTTFIIRLPLALQGTADRPPGGTAPHEGGQRTGASPRKGSGGKSPSQGP